jgi:hypothetical protein
MLGIHGQTAFAISRLSDCWYRRRCRFDGIGLILLRVLFRYQPVLSPKRRWGLSSIRHNYQGLSAYHAGKP